MAVPPEELLDTPALRQILRADGGKSQPSWQTDGAIDLHLFDAMGFDGFLADVCFVVLPRGLVSYCV